MKKIYDNKSEHMLNKFSNKNNKFASTPFYFLTMVMHRRRTLFLRYVLCYICPDRIRNTHAKHAKLSHVTG